jgi:hypothetical protein
MASSYSTDLKLELMVTGENAGTWGDITNTNLNILQQAIAGYESVALNATTGATLTFSNGVTSNGKNAVLNLTGSLTSSVNVVIPDGVEKTYTVKNATTGSFAVTFKTTSGTGATWSTTDKGTKLLYSDGTNVVDVLNNASQINLVNRNEVRFEDTTGGQYVALKAPATISSSFSLNLPTADGTSGQAIVTDGSGNLSFAAAGISTGKAIAMAIVFG